MVILLLFVVLTAVWWSVVWFVLPVDLAALAPPSLITLHVAPPVLTVFALLIGRQAWKWNATRKENARDNEKKAQEAADLAAKAVAREAELAARRAFIDCRAAWLAVPDEIPDWFMNESAQCRILEQDADSLREMERDAALSSSLQLVFEAALLQCEALAYLPLYLFPGHDDSNIMAQALACKAWQEALARVFQDEKTLPPSDCRLLPNTDEPLPDRVLTLFENDPAMPAMWLLGVDSLLDKATDGAAEIKPGHAIAALILSRPSLTLTEMDTIEKPDLSNPHLPHWEREQGYKDAPQWGSVPPSHRKALWDLPPVAALHRSRTLSFGEQERPRVKAQKLREMVEAVLIDATLRDPPPDTKADEAKKAEEPEPLDLGYLFHNSGADDDPATGKRSAFITAPLQDFDCPMSVDLAGNVFTEHGDTGAACPVLMLAEATMCAAQCELPVMVAEWEGADRLSIGIVRPATWT